MSQQRQASENESGVAATLFVAGHHTHAPEVYHSERDCLHLKQAERIDELSPDQVRQRDLRKCRQCSGAAETNNGMTPRTCPQCGAETGQLAHHIRNCDGGVSE